MANSVIKKNKVTDSDLIYLVPKGSTINISLNEISCFFAGHFSAVGRALYLINTAQSNSGEDRVIITNMITPVGAVTISKGSGVSIDVTNSNPNYDLLINILKIF